MHLPNHRVRAGPTSYADAFEDIDKNRVFANDTLFASKYYADGSEAGEMSKEERNDWPTYSNTSIVTPRISGYDYARHCTLVRIYSFARSKHIVVMYPPLH